MDGLIHGLLDVVIGDNNGDNNDDRDSNSPSRREERSRSSWAQVVSGEDDKNDEGGYAAGGSRNSNKWNREEGREEGRGNQAWGNAGQRHSSRPQYQKEEEDVHSEELEPAGRRPEKQSYKEKEDVNSEEWETVGSRPQKQTYKGDGDINNEGWETVGKRPQKHPHKVPMDQWNGYKRPTSEQTYSDDVEYGSTVEPSERELSSLSEACDKLWELDSNRLAPGKDYEIDCGDGKKPYQKEDMAQGSLFSWLSDDIFRRPTYSRFCSLLDNYNPAEGFKEVVTSQEQQEEQAFIEEISRTAPIKYVYEYLKSKGVVGGNYHNFKKLMIDLWFGLYGRGGTSRSSSAFEHVFVGEIKQRGEDAVSGFHNWIQFYLEEAKGNVDYQGYIFPRRRGEFPDAETQLLTIQFEWNGVLKSVSSTLIGVSPEFEVALYTLCFFMGGEDNHIQLGPYSVNVKCYRLGNDKIGSVFPIAE